MGYDNIKIFKSFGQRLEEYTYILTTFSPARMVPGLGPEIIHVWSNYLELQLQSSGWKAIWYILRRNCVDLGVAFPQIVEVMVRKVITVLFPIHLIVLYVGIILFYFERRRRKSTFIFEQAALPFSG